MIEGSPDDLMLRAQRIEERTVDVDEHVALWRARRPDGASAVLRLMEERAPPLCYPTLSPMMLQDPASRVFASSRAIRRGIDGVTQWALAPHAPGLNATALFDVLGEGTAPLDVVIHVAAELVGAFAILDEQARGLGVDNFEGRPSWPPPRKTFLVRPFDLRHVHFAFNGSVTLDVVTDTIRLERPAFELARMELLREAEAWRSIARQVIARVVTRLWSVPEQDTSTPLYVALHGHYDPIIDYAQGGLATQRLLSDARIPAGRAALREMLRALFPEQHRQARDLEESAAIAR